MAELKGSFGLGAKMKFGWYLVRTLLGSYHPSPGSLEGVDNVFPEKLRYVRRALRRNRILGRRILWIIAQYQKSFIDQVFLLGDEGGIFDQMCHSLAALVFALSLDEPKSEYLRVAEALDLEAELRMSGKSASPQLQTVWADVGRLLMQSDSMLFKDLIADIEVSDIPLDPRFIDRYI